MEQTKKGRAVLNDRALNKSTSFNREEREQLGLRGLLPYAITTQKTQIQRVMENIRRKDSNLERYVFLNALQDRNERLFYSAVIHHIKELMPIIYTPTVGQACKEFSHIFRQTKGLFITPEDKGEISRLLDNWPQTDIRVIVITDGQRILGLGDLGANGMGIPIGKLTLYTACAGIHPHQCLPVMFDVGTNNQEYLEDSLYLGYPHQRLAGQAYFDLMEEFILAVQQKFPNALIQFEDFQTPNAYALLKKYRNRSLCFNDDIQGTAAVVLAGIYASCRITGHALADLRIMFLGAGSASTGIADLMASALQLEGLTEKEAYSRLRFVDSKGLITSERVDKMDPNLTYTHHEPKLSLMEVIHLVKPHILIGATGAAGTFTREVIETMCAINEQPVIFALSNPTDRAECTAEEAYRWSKGKAVFASGSPFEPVTYNGKTFRSGQGNNAYIFPGIGLGAVACCATKITDELFLTAAKTLALLVSDQSIEDGTLYPPLHDIRNVSLQIAVEVAQQAYDLGLAGKELPKDLKQFIADMMYNPSY